MIQELMNRADQRGFVTFDDVIEVLEEDGDDLTSIESLLYELDELGIELQKEGEAREIVRNIQSERKNLGTTLDQKVNVELPRWPVEFEEEIKKKALIDKLSKGKFKVSPK